MTEEKDSICCSWYESCTYYMQCEHLYNENKDLSENVYRLEQKLKWANDEEKYLKDCCIKAGKELEKHSFKWDGKEKNLVVQALQLNQLYEKLEQENKDLKEFKKEVLKPVFLPNVEEEVTNTYRSALEEIRKIAISAFAKQRPYKEDFAEIENVVNKILNKG